MRAKVALLQSATVALLQSLREIGHGYRCLPINGTRQQAVAQTGQSNRAPAPSFLLMERFVLAMDQIAFGHGAFLFLHGAISHRPWNIRRFTRLGLEMHRLDSRSDRLDFQIDRRVSAPERPTTGVMKEQSFVHTGEVKPQYWEGQTPILGRTPIPAGKNRFPSVDLVLIYGVVERINTLRSFNVVIRCQF